MSLSRLVPSRVPVVVFCRFRSTNVNQSRSVAGAVRAGPWPAEKQLTVAPGVAGHFQYERDVSRDRRYSKPAKPGDTPWRFLVRRLGHAYELYPLLLLGAFWSVLFVYTVWYSFEKVEIWLDKTHGEPPPWDWERIRNNYWKKPTLWFDPEGVSRVRLPLMEQLQDEMMEAAKKRGTYENRGDKDH